MTTENTVTGDANPDLASSGDTDAQLAAMQVEESGGTEQAENTDTEKAKEQSPQADHEQKTTEDGKKWVPLPALHEERRARQSLERRFAEQGQMLEKVNQRLEVLFSPQKQVPDKIAAPVDYLDHRLDEVSELNKQILERDRQREEASQRANIENQLVQRVALATQEFKKVAPDVTEAGEYLNQIRARELMVLGVPEAQANEQAIQELNNALMGWAYQGQNPAQVAYELAKVRGYQVKQVQSAEQKIAAQQKGTAAARSLGGGGAVSAGKLTAEALANMSDEEFSKLTESQFRQAMGG